MPADIRSLYRWYFALPIAIVAIGLAIPVLYLFIRALGADPGRTADLVFNLRNLELLWNTLRLAAGVLAGSTLLAFPLAWLTSHTTFPCDPPSPS